GHGLENDLGGNDFGGALFLQDNAGAATISNSRFSTNHAIGLDGASVDIGGMNASPAEGGAIDSGFNTTLNLSGDVFWRNDAVGGDGGFGLKGSIGTGGIASGGAIFSRGNVNIDHAAFLSNACQSGDGSGEANTGAVAAAGGAVYVQGSFDVATRVAVSTSTFAGNRAV